MIRLSTYSVLLTLVPLLGAVYVLWRGKKQFRSPIPFFAGAAFLMLARILDVPSEVPGFRFIGIEDTYTQAMNTLLILTGDLSDIVGVGFLVFGFYQTIEFLRDTQVPFTASETILPVCAWCKRIRKSDDTWVSVEQFMDRIGSTSITHGVCPECSSRLKEDMMNKRSVWKRFTSDAGENLHESL